MKFIPCIISVKVVLILQQNSRQDELLSFFISKQSKKTKHKRQRAQTLFFKKVKFVDSSNSLLISALKLRKRVVSAEKSYPTGWGAVFPMLCCGQLVLTRIEKKDVSLVAGRQQLPQPLPALQFEVEFNDLHFWPQQGHPSSLFAAWLLVKCPAGHDPLAPVEV